MPKQKKFTQQFAVQYFAGEGGTNQIIYRTKITGCETEEDKLIDEARARYVEHPWVSKTATIMAYISKGGCEHVAMCEIIDRSRSAKR